MNPTQAVQAVQQIGFAYTVALFLLLAVFALIATIVKAYLTSARERDKDIAMAIKELVSEFRADRQERARGDDRANELLVSMNVTLGFIANRLGVGIPAPAEIIKEAREADESNKEAARKEKEKVDS